MRPRAILSALLLAAPLAQAQETTGDIRGRLRTGDGVPAVGATIVATSPDLLGVRRVTSASDGVFQLLALPPGTYSLRITKVGFRATTIDSIRVRLGRTEGLPDTELVAATAQLSEVRIAAPRVTLDPARTTIGATIEAGDLAALPAERDHRSLITIVPHVNTSYLGDAPNAGGSTGLENMYFIDGVNVTSPFNGATGTRLPPNFIRSVEVRAGGYEAQYGKALGAIVNAVTYAGTNEFATAAFGHFTHDAFATTPRAQPVLRETGSLSYDAGARVSGPLIRDRIWFSAAYNPRVDQAERIIAGHGQYTDRRRADLFAGKLSWQVTPETQLSLSAVGDPESHDVVADIYGGYSAINTDPYLRRRLSGGTSVAVHANTALGPRFRLEGVVSRFDGREKAFAATDRGRTDALFVDDVEQTVSGGMDAPLDVRQGRWSTSTRATVTAGRHTVTVGAEYEDTRTTRQFVRHLILRTATTEYSTWFDSTRGTFHNQVPAFFLQDAWRASNRLTLSAGIRWSRQRLTGASGGTAQMFPNEWQPRLGFSWELDARRTHRVLGSLGRFYQQIPLSLSTVFFADYVFLLKFYESDPRTPGALPTFVSDGSTYEKDWARSIDGLSTEHFDEATLGYERLVGTSARLTVRALHRHLRSSFQMGVEGFAGDTVLWVIGTPGKGNFDFLPPPRRDYTALEASVDGTWRTTRYRASYVLSRTWGNYTGLFGGDNSSSDVGVNFGLLEPHQVRNSTGFLPNDKTHVAKLIGTMPLGARWNIGSIVEWQSGAPLNGFGEKGPFGGPSFLVRRGTAGRTPGVWDVSLRLTSDVGVGARKGRVIMDLLHVGNFRTAVRFDQQHYFGTDAHGNPADVNTNYLRPLAFQPSMMARIGFETR